METTRKFHLTKTKKGLPGIWEEGGGATNTGASIIIAGLDGEPLYPIYVRTRGHLSNSEHALFKSEVGQIVIDANHHRGDFVVSVWKITEIMERSVPSSDGSEGTSEFEGKAILLCSFDQGEWDVDPEDLDPPYLVAAIRAAKDKSFDYHCREPHYVAIK